MMMTFALAEKGERTMPGKTRPSLRQKTLLNVARSNLSVTDKKCIVEVYSRSVQNV